ncbi:hypothetical protein B296_00053677 [Ensete ventricosum]|uniref:Uncharacterized protein n=1 Tax=Ensete ventricosum TaxID=4639 RepID=A0A426Y734_ENSVE|nr:hypothetical protein B296_00053677 [Ensete ventricosum]
MTILRMNKKPNAERKGPVTLIASLTVAGSISAIIKPCMCSEKAALRFLEIIGKEGCTHLDGSYGVAGAVMSADWILQGIVTLSRQRMPDLLMV